MTSRSNFSDDEWQQVTGSVIVAAAVISAADDVGEDQESELQEMQAFRDNLDKLANKQKKSAFVQEVAAALASNDMDDFWDAHGAMGSAVSHENPLEDRLAEVKSAAAIVDRVADKKDAKAYKKFVYDAARTVASASKESFFALSSSISKKEDFYLRQLRTMLGL